MLKTVIIRYLNDWTPLRVYTYTLKGKCTGKGIFKWDDLPIYLMAIIDIPDQMRRSRKVSCRTGTPRVCRGGTTWGLGRRRSRRTWPWAACRTSCAIGSALPRGFVWLQWIDRLKICMGEIYIEIHPYLQPVCKLDYVGCLPTKSPTDILNTCWKPPETHTNAPEAPLRNTNHACHFPIVGQHWSAPRSPAITEI